MASVQDALKARFSKLKEDASNILTGISQIPQSVGKSIQKSYESGILKPGPIPVSAKRDAQILQARNQGKNPYEALKDATINSWKLPFISANTPEYQKLTTSEKIGSQSPKFLSSLAGVNPLTNAMTSTSGLAGVGLTLGLGGGINKLSGGSFTQGVANTAETLPTIYGIGKFTNPAIANIANKSSARINNPITRSIINRGVSGVGSIPEGMVMSGGLGRQYTPTDALLDVGFGAITGGANRPRLSEIDANVYRNKNNALKEHIQTLEQKIKSLSQNGGSKTAIKQYQKAIDNAYREIVSNRQMAGKLGLKAGIVGTTKNTDPLIAEAKKYKSAEEFVRQDFQNKVIAGQDLGKEIGKNVNPDGTITLYHGTSKQNAENILKSGEFKDGAYFSVRKAGTEYGDSPIDVAKRKFGKDATVIEVKVDARDLESAAAGSEVFSPKKLVKQEDGSWVSDSVKTKSQLTSIYNQAKGVENTQLTPRLELQESPRDLLEEQTKIGIKQSQTDNNILSPLDNSISNRTDVIGKQKVYLSQQADLFPSKPIEQPKVPLMIEAPRELIANTPTQAKQLFKKFGQIPEFNFVARDSKVPIKIAGETITSKLTSNAEKLKDINVLAKGLTPVYENFKTVFGKAFPEIKSKILDPFDTAKESNINMQKSYTDELYKTIVQGLGIKKGSKESQLVQLFGEKRIELDDLRKAMPDKWRNIVMADEWFRNKYNELLDTVNESRAKIYPNNAEKQIPRRQDYYRHFREMQEGLGALKNIFESPSGISPTLAGTSDYTKPKSKWLSMAQKRIGFRTQEDAVGGFIDYIKQSSYATHIDPYIPRFRAVKDELINATSKVDDPNTYAKVNNFIEFLNDFEDGLAGKTNVGDRFLQKYLGRRTFRAINWLNNRVKANVIVGNVSSMVAQTANIPLGIAEVNAKNFSKGLPRFFASVYDKSSVIKSSPFLKERYSSSMFDKFDTKALDKIHNFVGWLTSVGDEIGTKAIWSGAYEKALAEGITNPIKYADDIARKVVGGRGVGEVANLQKSQVFQLAAPFQLEVTNTARILSNWLSNKEVGKVITFMLASYMFNRAYEKVRGSDVIVDPIQASLEAIQAYNEEDDKRIGAMRAGGRIAGEVLSNVPLGQSVAGAYPEYGIKFGDTQLPTRKDLFGQGDPTRFGSGLLASGFADPFYKILPSYGGAQIKKTIEGVNTYNKGYSETQTGKVRYPVEQNVPNAIRTTLFGQYSTPEAREYFDKERTPLSKKQSEMFKQSGKDYYNQVMENRETNREKNKLKEQMQKELDGETGFNPLDMFKPKEAQASSKWTDEDTILYSSNGEVKELNISKYTKKPADEIERIRLEADKFSEAVKVYRNEDIAKEDKDKIFGKLGVKPQDIAYYDIASDSAEVRRSAIDMVMKREYKDRTEMLTALGAMRYEITSGTRILTDTTVDELYNDGVISYAEKKYLKDVKFVKGKKPRLKSSKSSGGRKPKAPQKLKIKAIKAPNFQQLKSIQLGDIAPKVQQPKINIQPFKVQSKPLELRLDPRIRAGM